MMILQFKHTNHWACKVNLKECLIVPKQSRCSWRGWESMNWNPYRSKLFALSWKPMIYLQPCLLAMKFLLFCKATTYMWLSTEEEKANFYSHHCVISTTLKSDQKRMFGMFSRCILQVWIVNAIYHKMRCNNLSMMEFQHKHECKYYASHG